MGSSLVAFPQLTYFRTVRNVNQNLITMKVTVEIVILIISFSLVNSRTIMESRGYRHAVYPGGVSQEVNNLIDRQKRNTHSEIRGMLSITNNFEVLRRRYLATIKEQNRLRASRQNLDRTQIQENQNFLDSVG